MQFMALSNASRLITLSGLTGRLFRVPGRQRVHQPAARATVAPGYRAIELLIVTMLISVRIVARCDDFRDLSPEKWTTDCTDGHGYNHCLYPCRSVQSVVKNCLARIHRTAAQGRNSPEAGKPSRGGQAKGLHQSV